MKLWVQPPPCRFFQELLACEQAETGDNSVFNGWTGTGQIYTKLKIYKSLRLA
jgi:hypothetical protein